MRTELAACCILGLLFAGCGGSASGKYELSGSVTFQGQPVPAGSIRFEPDVSAGNSGPGAQVEIKNGRYQTLKSQGVMGGPHKVTISGTDGVPFDIGGMMNPQGKPLFDDYTTTANLPKQNGTQDFTVPAK